MTETSNCPECGRETEPAAAACPHCGAAIPPGAEGPAPLTAYEVDGMTAFLAFFSRLAVFNALYYGTVKGLDAYERYAYGDQAMPGMASPGVAMLVIGGFFVTNAVYLMLEAVCRGYLKRARAGAILLFPAASYVGIVLIFVAYAALKYLTS